MKTAEIGAPRARRPPNAGKGRRKGVPNRATSNAREAITRLVEGNVDRLQEWLDAVAKEDPAAALRCVVDLLEFSVPRLSRVEHTTPPERSVEELTDEELAEVIRQHPGAPTTSSDGEHVDG